jgi:hypothetical protein
MQKNHLNKTLHVYILWYNKVEPNWNINMYIKNILLKNPKKIKIKIPILYAMHIYIQG